MIIHKYMFYGYTCIEIAKNDKREKYSDER